MPKIIFENGITVYGIFTDIIVFTSVYNSYLFLWVDNGNTVNILKD